MQNKNRGKIRYTWLKGVFLFSIFLISAEISNAQVPNHINYQGKLKDSGGNPITGTVTIQFSLYSHITNGSSGDVPGAGGPLLWTETYDGNNSNCQQITPGTDGIFAQHLGKCVPFPSYLDFTDEYYLGVKIDTDAEATPRVPLATNPYAFTTKSVHTESEDALIDTQTSGNILLHSAGNIQLQANDVTSAFIVDQQGTGNLFELQNNGTTSFIVQNNGFVGIGTSTPTQRLHIAGNMRLEGAFYDFNNEVGTSGQVLSSTVNGVDWIDSTSLPSNNIYTADGVLNADRLVSMGANSLTFAGTSGTTVGLLYADDYSANYVDRSIVDKGYVDSQLQWEILPIGGSSTSRIQPKNNQVRQIYVEENSNSYTQFMVRNNNDTGNGAGAIIELKGSGADYSNNMYIGKYGASFWIPELQDNGAVLTDKNLVIGTASDSHEIHFVTGNSYTDLQPVVVADNEGFRYTSDLSATFVDRTLIDKAYVDGTISSSAPTFQDVVDKSISLNGFAYADLGAGEIDDDGGQLRVVSHVGSDFVFGAENMLTFNFDGGTNHAHISDQRVGAAQAGIEYDSDYSTNFTNRSLVDKEYVDSKIGTSIWDANLDTGVEVEANPDEDRIRFTTDGNERMVIDENGGIGINTSLPLTADVQIGQGGHLNAVMSVNGNANHTAIVGFRDRDGEDIFTSMGSLANNDFVFAMGDLSGAYSNIYGGYNQIILDQATSSYKFGRAPLQFIENETNGQNYVGFLSPASIDTNTIWTLPNADGGSHHVLQTDGAGTLSWLDPATFTNIYTADGALLGDRHIDKAGHFLEFNGAGNLQFLTDSGPTLAAFMTNATGAQFMVQNDDPWNVLEQSIKLSTSSMLVTDDRNNRGLEYNDDYSANFINRSLVDKEYVDNLIPTVSNGLTKTGNDIQLGGALDTDTWLTTGKGKEFYVGRPGDSYSRYTGGAIYMYDIPTNTRAQYYADNFQFYDDNSGYWAQLYHQNGDILEVKSSNSGGFKGLAYDIDYSANYTNRSLVDKEYVDGLLSGSSIWTKVGTNLSPTVAGDDVLLNAGESLTLSDLSQGSVVFTGAGGLVSQDNSNFFWDDTNNNLGLGTITPGYNLTLVGDGSDPQRGSIELATYADSGAPSGIYFHRAGGTNDAPTAISDGLPMGGVVAGGYDGNSMIAYSGGMLMEATENWSNAAHGTKLSFSTTENGTTSMLNRMVIDDEGKVGIGTTNPVTPLHVFKLGQDIPLLTLGDTIGDMQIFITAHNPEGSIVGSPGDLAIDNDTNGFVYIKTSGEATDNGWVRLLASDNSITELYDVDTATNVPTNGQVLSWNGINWVPATASVDNIYNTNGVLNANRNITLNNYNLSFDNNKVFIDGANGNVGIGINNPSYKLDVTGEVMLDSIASAPTASQGYAGIYSNGGELYAFDENGNSTQISPHNKETNEWIYDSKNVKTGKSLHIEMEKLMKELDHKLGGGYIIENGEKSTYDNGDSFIGVNDAEPSIITELVDDVRNVLENIAFKAEVEFEKTTTFFADVIFTDKVTFMNRVTYADKDVAGSAVIKTGKKKVNIEFENSFMFIPYVTAVVNNEFILFKVTNITQEGFDIKIQDDAQKDIKFTWHAIAVANNEQEQQNIDEQNQNDTDEIVNSVNDEENNIQEEVEQETDVDENDDEQIELSDNEQEQQNADEQNNNGEVDQLQSNDDTQNDVEENNSEENLSQQDSEQKQIKILNNKFGFVKVRQEATTSSVEIAQVHPEEEFVFSEVHNGWYYIEYSQNKHGWISGVYVEKL